MCLQVIGTVLRLGNWLQSPPCRIGKLWQESLQPLIKLSFGKNVRHEHCLVEDWREEGIRVWLIRDRGLDIIPIQIVCNLIE